MNLSGKGYRSYFNLIIWVAFLCEVHYKEEEVTMAFNYAAAYQNNKVQTASKGELTLMLYDAGIKFVNMAINAIDKNNIQAANDNIKKAENVIAEFRSTLDHKYRSEEHTSEVQSRDSSSYAVFCWKKKRKRAKL